MQREAPRGRIGPARMRELFCGAPGSAASSSRRHRAASQPAAPLIALRCRISESAHCENAARIDAQATPAARPTRLNAESSTASKFCCSHTSTPSSTVNRIECLKVLANTTPSLPLSSVVATPGRNVLRRDHLAHHAARRVRRRHQHRVQIQLIGRHHLQVAEQRVARRVAARQEHRDPAEERRHQREERADRGDAQAERVGACPSSSSDRRARRWSPPSGWRCASAPTCRRSPRRTRAPASRTHERRDDRGDQDGGAGGERLEVPDRAVRRVVQRDEHGLVEAGPRHLDVADQEDLRARSTRSRPPTPRSTAASPGRREILPRTFARRGRR